jgi:sulfur-carrier protein adenylyltransferase/sulfurtransferase
MNTRLKLASVLIPLGILVAAIPDGKVMVNKSNPDQILAEMKDGNHLITTDAIADMLVQKDPSLQLIDVRSQAEYEQYHLQGAVNVPLDNILSEENSGWFEQDTKMNVLYGNGTSAGTEAWMLLRQKGYKGLYVLQGGMNYWAETIMNPSQPVSTASNDEIARYDFRKAAGGVLGGGTLAPTSSAVGSPAPAAPKAGAPKKKRAAGGC